MATASPFQIGRDPSAASQTSLVEEQIFDPRRILAALWRRKIMIGGLMVVGLCLAFLYVSQLTPLYSASSTLLLETPKTKITNIEGFTQTAPVDYFTIETKAAVIESRDIAGKVVDRLDLYEDPLFNLDLAPREAGLWETISNLFAYWTGSTADSTGAEESADDRWAGYTPEEKHAALREELIDSFQAGLSVTPSQRALLVTIEYASSDPDMAAIAANATAEVYIRDQIQSAGSVTEKATQWLAERAASMRQRVIASEKRLEAFRRQSGIVNLQGSSLLQEQIAKINSSLIAARAARAEADARYRQVQTLLKSEGGIGTAAAVLDAPLIQRLREQETQIQRQLAELNTQLRGGHPRLALKQNELKDLQSNIALEVTKIVTNLKNELEIARVRENNLKSELANLDKEGDKQNAAAVTLRALQTEADANKQLYETIIARFKETDVVSDQAKQADAKIISRATVPGLPFYPRKGMMIAVALFFSAALGIALAIILDFLDSGFRSTQQIEDALGLPAVGTLPLLSRVDRDQKPHDVAARKPNSIFGEAVRSIRTALMLSGVDKSPKTILVTSSVSGEGKTSLSLSLTSLAARTGQRAIILDCDLRRASVHKTLGVSNEVGLSNYLSGQADLGEVIGIEQSTGLHFIPAGGRVPHPTDLLGSKKMYALLETLGDSYDMILLDTPPLLAVSDALVLVRTVDRVLFVVRWEKTRRDFVGAAVKQVVDAGANVGGVVLSQVDMKKQSRYGYGTTNTYYYDNPKYFTE
ncbi:MAG: polysaccharide biosynthesis tyrosine autokinase [Rhodospirillaceae bacterium]|jgi:polysaccharide biosynthesis transport protein|nr:polysaccharide biosynthesis tyrosine autokinase [Rhodospirillaceae bacterium]MBT5455755.1 polysaccharide biosynthesis tyrosine autokinase [Rhodospirillaceae bacterium]